MIGDVYYSSYVVVVGEGFNRDHYDYVDYDSALAHFEQERKAGKKVKMYADNGDTLDLVFDSDMYREE